ncbi:MAG: F390 synthetase-related protein [Candidatus Heimdallarchaeaceae archaeon]
MFNPLRFLWRVNKRFKRWDEDEIKEYQRKQIEKLIKFAVKKSKFYSTFYNGYDLTIYRNLPFMNKQLFMDNFTQLNTAGLTKEECINHCLEKEQSRDFSEYYKGYLVGMSTGTSGNKGIEFVSKMEAFLMQLLVFFRFPFPKTRKIHLAFILRVFSPGFGHNGVKIRISYVSPLDTIETIVEKLNMLKPNLISGPPSVLQVLARAKKDGSLKVSPLLIISYGEVLSSNVKRIVEKDFICSVVEVYKSSESFIALPCKNGNLHINEDTTLIEVLDNNHQPVKPGNPGFVVVTDFIKRKTPIIRYQLNDLITIDPEPCSCGSKFRVIKQVHGRADDIILGKKIRSDDLQFILPDFIRRSIISSSEHIEEYNVIQTSPTNLIIKLQLVTNVKEQIKEEIEKTIQQNLVNIFTKHDSEVPNIEFLYVSLKQDFDKKLRRIRRNFEEDFLK